MPDLRPHPLPDSIETALRSLPDGVAINVKVIPRASRTKFIGMLGSRLKVALAAPAEAGKANQALRELFSQSLDVPLRNVVISAGLTSPQKTVELIGITACQALPRLRQLLA